MSGPAPSLRRPTEFLLLMAAVAVPLWLLSPHFGVITALRIPTTDLLLAFLPMAAGLALTARESGWRGALDLLRRAFDPRGLLRSGWFAAVVLLPPLIYGGAWAVIWVAGQGAPAPDFVPLRLIALFFLFFLLAAGEEVGWMGYAFTPLQDRLGAVGASLALAVVWWAAHLPSMAEIHATGADIAGWAVGAVALRIIMSWLYNNSGGHLFGMVLFHALLNLSRIAIYPSAGAHYSTLHQATGYGIASLIALAVLIATSPRTLTR